MNLPLVVASNFNDLDLLRTFPPEYQNLVKLEQLRIPHVHFFGLTKWALSAFLHHEHLDSKLAKVLSTGNETKIKALILHASLPYPLIQAIRLEYQKIPSPKVVVFNKQILKGDTLIFQSLRRVYADFIYDDLKSNPTRSFISFNHAPFILIKEFPPAQYTARIYTIDPYINEKTRMVFQFVGGVTPPQLTSRLYHQIQVNRQTGSELTYEPQSNYDTYSLDSYGRIIKTNRKKPVIKPTPTILKHWFMLSRQIHNAFLSSQQVDLVTTARATQIQKITPLSETTTFNQDSLNPLSQLSLILTGVPAGQGIATGFARVISSDTTIATIKPQEIAVVPEASWSILPKLNQLSGIVSELGGATSHLAIIAREYGLPSVMSAFQATKLIKTGDVITINGATGQVYFGSPETKSKPIILKDNLPHTLSPLATKILLDTTTARTIITHPESNTFSVGLFRGEVLFSEIGLSPETHLHDRNFRNQYKQLLKNRFLELSEALNQQVITYRLADFRSNERLSLREAVSVGPETNPFLGLRGTAYRLSVPDLFKLEIEALQEIKTQYQISYNLILPFVRDAKEILLMKRLMLQFGYQKTSDSKLFASVDTPSSLFSLDAIINTKIDGLYLNLNHLSMLVLAIDEENPNINQNYDQNHPAIMEIIEIVLQKIRPQHFPVFFYGEAVNISRRFIHHLVRFGASGVIVPPNVVQSVHSALSQAEYLQLR